MTIEQLFMWHRQEQERWAHLAEHTKTTAHKSLKESVKRGYRKKAEFHEQAAALLKPMLHTNEPPMT